MAYSPTQAVSLPLASLSLTFVLQDKDGYYLASPDFPQGLGLRAVSGLGEPRMSLRYVAAFASRVEAERFVEARGAWTQVVHMFLTPEGEWIELNGADTIANIAGIIGELGEQGVN